MVSPIVTEIRPHVFVQTTLRDNLAAGAKVAEGSRILAERISR